MASPLPEGGYWRTTDDGHHIYILGKSVVAGMGMQASRTSGHPKLSQEEWEKSLSPEHIKSLQAWSKGSDQKIRDHQLNGTGNAKIQEHTKNIREALKSAPSPNTTIFRGMKNLDPEAVSAMTTPGNQIHYRTFSSWSMKAAIARNFSRDDEAKGGSSAIFAVHNAKKVSDISGISKFKHEKEVLAGEGSRYRVLSSEKLNELNAYGNDRLKELEEYFPKDKLKIAKLDSPEKMISYAQSKLAEGGITDPKIKQDVTALAHPGTSVPHDKDPSYTFAVPLKAIKQTGNTIHHVTLEEV